MAIIYDLVDLAELTGFVRDLAFPEMVLDGILPNEQHADIAYRLRRATIQRRAATYRAWDTEAPIAKRGPLSTIEGEIPPLSEKIRLGEYDRLRAAADRGDGGARDEIVDTIFDDAQARAWAIQARIEIARGDVLTDGKFTLTNENGLSLEVDYGLPGTHLVAPGVLWSDTVNSVPLTNLKAWVRVWRQDNGGASPGVILTSDDVISNLLLNAQIRAMLVNNGVTPAFASLAQVNQVLAAHTLPPIVAYDGQIVDAAGSTVNVIPKDRVLLLPARGADLGMTLYGTTAEALELVSEGRLVRSDAPGIVVTVDKHFDPVSIWTKASGIALPVLRDVNKLLVADVQ